MSPLNVEHLLSLTMRQSRNVETSMADPNSSTDPWPTMVRSVADDGLINARCWPKVDMRSFSSDKISKNFIINLSSENAEICAYFISSNRNCQLSSLQGLDRPITRVSQDKFS